MYYQDASIETILVTNVDILATDEDYSDGINGLQYSLVDTVSIGQLTNSIK